MTQTDYKDSESIKIGNYYICREGDKLKITLVDLQRNNISIIPSSGNSVIIKPESSGDTQFKTK